MGATKTAKVSASPSPEQQIKDQYAVLFDNKNWRLFKKTAEYYLDTAAHLKTADLRPCENPLQIRNSQKRLFLGIGCELLVKSFFLKEGYCIHPFNREFRDKKNDPKWCAKLHRLSDLNVVDLDHRSTLTFNILIDHLRSLTRFSQAILTSLTIAKVFRNKEGHCTTFNDLAITEIYTDFATGLVAFYKEGFGEALKMQISMKPNEVAAFNVRKSAA